MANTFYLKKGDTYPFVTTILSDASGPVNLSGATVLFRMSEAGSGNLMLEKAAVVGAPNPLGGTPLVVLGACYADLADGDTDVVGIYKVEWKVTFGSGKKATFPRGQTENFNQIIIQDIVD